MHRLVCMANSYKPGGRCLAALDLEKGDWVRPVTDHEHGTLHDADYRDMNGRELGILDVFSLGLAEARPTPYQPENWLGDFPSGFLKTLGRSEALRFLEAHRHTGGALFGNSYDRVRQSELDQRPVGYSLALVEPDVVTIRIATNWSGQKRPYVQFAHDAYEQVALSVTDPVWRHKLDRLRFGEHKLNEVGVRSSSRVFLTVSLGEPFNGDCYKLVAGVIVL